MLKRGLLPTFLVLAMCGSAFATTVDAGSTTATIQPGSYCNFAFDPAVHGTLDITYSASNIPGYMNITITSGTFFSDAPFFADNGATWAAGIGPDGPYNGTVIFEGPWTGYIRLSADGTYIIAAAGSLEFLFQPVTGGPIAVERGNTVLVGTGHFDPSSNTFVTSDMQVLIGTPEPSTFLLFSTGTLACFAAGRRRFLRSSR